ncbi:protein of unknown function [Aminobacter niigataensis]|nr:protein of unknown function [Aminobacter niigataensis]
MSLTRFSRDFMTRHSRTTKNALALAYFGPEGPCRTRTGPELPAMENKLLKFFSAGNHSFTGIVNHTHRDLRPGKDSGFRRECDRSFSGVA